MLPEGGVCLYELADGYRHFELLGEIEASLFLGDTSAVRAQYEWKPSRVLVVARQQSQSLAWVRSR